MSLEQPNNNNKIKQFNASYIGSGLIIGLSFIAMLVPLALFHAAQIGSIMRLRNSVYVLLSVALILCVAGLVLSLPSFLYGGINALFWLPIFTIVLSQRRKQRPVFFTVVLLSIPTLLLFWFAATFPHKAEFDSIIALFKEQLSVSKNMLSPGTGTTDLQVREGFNKFLNESSFIDHLNIFAGLNFWQRLSWLVFDKGSGIFISSVFVWIANLLFLDFAFEQTEKLKSVSLFVKENLLKFSNAIANSLGNLDLNLPDSEAIQQQSLPRITRINYLPEDAEEDFSWFYFFFRKYPRNNFMQLMNVQFSFEFPKQSWRLRNLKLLLPVVVSAILFLAFVSIVWKTPQELLTASALPYGSILGMGGAVSVIVLCVVAVQGVIVLLERLTPKFLLLLLVIILGIFSVFSITVLYLLAAFCIFGLLDYLYDFRGQQQLANKTKAV